MDDNEDDAVDKMLHQARTEKVSVPPALVTRVLADAERLQPTADDRPDGKAKVRRIGFSARPRRSALGAFGGLAAASCLGFWIGINPPVALESVPWLELETLDALLPENGAEISGFGWDVGEI